MMEAHTPKIMAGWISQCVKWVVLETLGLSRALVKSAMFMAIMVVSSSSVSKYLFQHTSVVVDCSTVSGCMLMPPAASTQECLQAVTQWISAVLKFWFTCLQVPFGFEQAQQR